MKLLQSALIILIGNDDKIKDYLAKILSSGNHLLSLINDVLDMSRIESGKIHLEESEINLSDILHHNQWADPCKAAGAVYGYHGCSERGCVL